MFQMLRLLKGTAKFIILSCFLLALAAFSAVATVRYIFATSEVEIPDLVGEELAYASDLLAERHLTLKTVGYQLDTDIPKDHIVAQDPAPGTMTKKNRTVRVILSKGAESALIPDVIGKRWQEAKRILRQSRFRIGNVAYAHSAEVPVDCIVAQTPLPHSESSIGERIDLLVSLGVHKTVMVMPDLVEERLPYALQVIEKLGLVLGKIEHDESYTGIPDNTVLSQVPKPGTLVEEQNIVTFVVSGSARTPQAQDTPQPVQYETLEYTVPAGWFEQEAVILVKNTEGTTEIYRQLVKPAQRIVVRIPVVGDTVAEIYLDGVLEEIQRITAE